MSEYKGINWYNYQGALLPRVPPHQEVFLTQQEEIILLKKSKTLFLRYTNEWDREKSKFWYVVKDSFGGLEELSGNTRSKIRRGKKRNYVKKVEAGYIARFGYEVYARAFEHYSTFIKPVKKEKFQEQILFRNTKKVYEYWAVFDKQSDKLVAYSENFIEDKICHYSTIKFHPEYLKSYISYILFYEMNQYYLKEKKFKYVSDGARSISHDTNVQTYLIDKFRFRKAFVKLNVVYRRDVKLAVMLLYPLRAIISKIDHPVLDKISVILKQENIRRSFES